MEDLVVLPKKRNISGLDNIAAVELGSDK